MSVFESTTPMLKAVDVGATADFYADVLGFTTDTLWPDDEPTLCILVRGGVRIMFGTAGDWDSPGTAPSTTGQLVFDVNDVRALHESIRKKVEIQ